MASQGASSPPGTLTYATKRRKTGGAKMAIEKHGRFWAVRDESGELVCITVYKRGAKEVIRRLSGDRIEVRGVPA